MEIYLTDFNNSSGQDITKNINVLSNAKVTLKKCEADITSIRDTSFDKSNIHKAPRKVNKMSSATRIVADEILGIETNSYVKSSDFNF